ncbi:hypothetical protein WCE10_21850, partial [Cronobacter muytjensii]|uniref:hypothetical protein n=1 Tax=Cronobacter muytjensii TaxID=413501 RepID=UPI0034D6051D
KTKAMYERIIYSDREELNGSPTPDEYREKSRDAAFTILNRLISLGVAVDLTDVTDETGTNAFIEGKEYDDED